MDDNSVLSKNFRLKEFERSQICDRQDWDNTAPVNAVENLKELCKLLEQIRERFGGKPLRISSGYRCKLLNDYLGSKDSSHHRFGQAADFEIPTYSNKYIYLTLKQMATEGKIVFTQMILEYHDVDDPSSGWIHISLDKSNLLCQSFIIERTKSES